MCINYTLSNGQNEEGVGLINGLEDLMHTKSVSVAPPAGGLSMSHICVLWERVGEHSFVLWTASHNSSTTMMMLSLSPWDGGGSELDHLGIIYGRSSAHQDPRMEYLDIVLDTRVLYLRYVHTGGELHWLAGIISRIDGHLYVHMHHTNRIPIWNFGGGFEQGCDSDSVGWIQTSRWNKITTN